MRPGMGIVVDNVTGLTDTAFFEIPVVEATGQSTVTVFPPLCSGSLGNISVAVAPGTNFAIPYTFSITTSAGMAVADPGALPAGSYLLYVADADSCVLPPHAFVINSPPLLTVTATLTGENCEQGGQIALGIAGGQGTTLSIGPT